VYRFWNAVPSSDVFASNATALQFAKSAMPLDFDFAPQSFGHCWQQSQPNVSSNPTRGLLER
jgi:hypothetical protein